MTTGSSDSVLIGEGVVLETASASVGLRLLSGLIDYLALLLAFWIIATVFLAPMLASGDFDESSQNAITTVVLFGVLLGVPIAIETMTRGSSLGRAAAGIRIVRDDGGPTGLRQAITRTLAGVFEVWLTLGSIAVIASMSSSRGKRVGDMLAGTYAIRVRARRGPTLALAVPPSMVEWSRTADVRRLPDGVALAARHYFLRAPQLSTSLRMRLATEIAESLTPYVAPLPSSDIHPETFIAAVLATRRDRELVLATSWEAVDAIQARAVERLPFGVAEAHEER